ncbi:TetR/AcrR family transcriptional regulator [Microbacterium sp. SORGH_AS_0888]|uniref:TetR/AcrR family transcriptional regulator n=1 Tax=Microbacterium sp. SORGH_AS_0888 TaxID=3041791 RepID=UPI002785213B|nr:TetR/AcrR family transcriptional regulator C-terminal domain-containing protein [Microbacterium sp. SORGH_AS_0888]MDQ1131214.1 AcrR family transcriptional regulator [Microbacterium sp. SORGH_AS_0888]
MSREEIVRAAIEILEESGETGLTFRMLSERLRSGSGAIYWHVSNRNELLDLACEQVLANVATANDQKPIRELEAIRSIALSLFDNLDRHPWVGARLPKSPGLHGTLRVLDRIGGLLDSYGVPAKRQFYVATAIVTYVMGVAAQMADNAQSVTPGQTQDEWLMEQSKRWEELDAERYPFLHATASDFRHHDDRSQFTVGLDLILLGIQRDVDSPGR